MKSMKKALLIVLCAALLVTASVMGTMAYLTSTDSVTNTFTVGKVTITMDETKVDEYGVADTNADRVEKNQYKLIPGHEYTKDPTIHVAKESEKCYLFVKIENGLADYEATGETTIAAQLAANNWEQITGTNVYYYKNTIDPSVEDSALDIKVFEKFTIADNADAIEDWDKIAKVETDGQVTNEGASIVVTAYAVQADGFDTAEEAWSTSNVGESTSGN